MHLVDYYISLKPLSVGDVTSNYMNWLNDRNTVQYFGLTQIQNHTMGSIMEWVDKVTNDNNVRLFKIVLNNTNEFIGTARIDIDWIWRVGTVSLMIGDASYRRKGIGTRVIEGLTLFAFDNLNLHRCEAGILDGNIASYKAFSKAGYVEEGRQKERRFINGKYVDSIMMGKVNGN